MRIQSKRSSERQSRCDGRKRGEIWGCQLIVEKVLGRVLGKGYGRHGGIG
jgi:hypothetical protein